MSPCHEIRTRELYYALKIYNALQIICKIRVHIQSLIITELVECLATSEKVNCKKTQSKILEVSTHQKSATSFSPLSPI